MDDSKSDNTDDLLTSIDPMLNYSSVLINQHTRYSYKIPEIPLEEADKTNEKVVLEDIMSARSELSSKWRLSKENLAKYEESIADSDKTIATHQWAHSVTPNSARSYASTVNNYDGYSKEELVEKVQELTRNEDLLNGKLRSSNIEKQRLDISNKQIQSQLRDTKSALQSVTVQLEHTQQECIHKENALENLDKTLAGLVTAWKKRETQKNTELDQLRQQLQEKQICIQDCQGINEETKRALINADKALINEKQQHNQTKEDLIEEIDSLRQETCRANEDKETIDKEITKLSEEVRKYKEQISKLSIELDNKVQIIDELENNHQMRNRQFDEELLNWKQKSDNLDHELSIREHKIIQAKQEVDQWEEEANKWRREIFSKDEEVKSLKSKLQDLEVKNTHQLKRIEREIQAKSTEMHRVNLEELKSQHKRELQKLNSEWQQKISDRSHRHKQELEKLRQTAEREISLRVSDADETIKSLRERLERADQSVRFWQKEKESVERARSQLSATLCQAATQLDSSNSQYSTNQMQLVTNNTPKHNNQSYDPQPSTRLTGRTDQSNISNNNLLTNHNSFVPPSSNHFQPIKSSIENIHKSANSSQWRQIKPSNSTTFRLSDTINTHKQPITMPQSLK